MYTSKLVDVFYALSKTQLRALRKFVKSPYHNKRQDVVELFELMYKTPLENRTALRKEKVFPKLFGKEAYSPDKMDYTMSFLFKTIEQFLIHQHAVSDKTNAQIALMEAYRNLGLNKHFQQSAALALKQQKKEPLRDLNYHERAFNIEFIQYEFLSRQQRNTPKNLQELSTKLDLRFLSQKLKDACRLLAHQAVAKQQYDFGLLNSILPYINEHLEILEHPSIALYYYYYQAATIPEKSEHYFQQFKTTFFNCSQAFQDIELKNVYTLALNYCVKRVNLGQPEYQQELFDFYDAGLRLKILIDNGILSQFTFNNITKLALRLNKIKWTEDFIENYKGLVDERYHDTYVHNAYSMLYFAQGKYEETMVRLQQVDHKELFITLDAKVLLIKVYYQLDEYDVLESFINSFKVFLRRKDILAYHRDIYKNFIRFTQKLINLPPFDKEARLKLLQEIVKTQKLLEKTWLLEQLQ